MELDSLEFFYKNYIGYTPDVSQKIHNTTQAMIHHMFESKLWLENIFQVYEVCAADGYIAPNNIPRYLWAANNLMDFSEPYIHKNLVLRSKAPYFDGALGKLVSYPYYFENIEFYSLDNLVDYAYNQLNIHPSLQDRKRDKGLLNFYLQKYKDVPAPTLDYVLFMIDAAAENPMPKNINDISQYEAVTLSSLQFKIQDLKNQGLYKIVWRQV